MNGQGILIVEDESIVALDMRMRLEAMGYRVVDIVDTGALALERAASAGPDLILLDIKLKGPMDGIETARALRGIASIPVIFVTAFADEKTLQRAKLASAYGYIIKPYHERELRVAIELALYKHEYELSVLRARDLAEEANRLKGEFLANISHELKTPLNSVIGFVQLGLDRADDDEQRENLGMALGGARSLLDLIDSILAFTKMEAGRLTPASLPFSLGTLVGECVDILAMNASRKGLDASFRWEPGLPDRVVGDEALVRRVMLNLIDNATKFTEAGRVRLELSRAEGRGEGAQTLPLLISVTDTGIGMPPEKVESAFERFTQLDGSSTRRAGGAGLGLAIVRKSLESIGGRVEVDSAPGRGTRVTAHLSLGLPEGDAESAREEALRARRLVITGFGEEEGGDLEELASSMGAECLFADRLEEAAAMRGLPLVICDERILHRGGGGSLALPEKSLAALSRRLIVAVRFGSPCRAWTGFPEGVAFATMPLRAGRLSDAVAALGRPAEERTAGPEGTAAAGAQDAEQRGLLLDFAEALEEASRSGIAGEAERIAKEMSKDCARLGFREGERLAFSALLATRKGEAAGLARFALRARSLAGLCQGSAGKTDYAEG